MMVPASALPVPTRPMREEDRLSGAASRDGEHRCRSSQREGDPGAIHHLLFLVGSGRGALQRRCRNAAPVSAGDLNLYRHLPVRPRDTTGQLNIEEPCHDQGQNGDGTAEAVCGVYNGRPSMRRSRPSPPRPTDRGDRSGRDDLQHCRKLIPDGSVAVHTELDVFTALLDHASPSPWPHHAPRADRLHTCAGSLAGIGPAWQDDQDQAGGRQERDVTAESWPETGGRPETTGPGGDRPRRADSVDHEEAGRPVCPMYRPSGIAIRAAIRRATREYSMCSVTRRRMPSSPCQWEPSANHESMRLITALPCRRAARASQTGDPGSPSAAPTTRRR